MTVIAGSDNDPLQPSEGRVRMTGRRENEIRESRKLGSTVRHGDPHYMDTLPPYQSHPPPHKDTQDQVM